MKIEVTPLLRTKKQLVQESRIGLLEVSENEFMVERSKKYLDLELVYRKSKLN